LDFWAGPRRRGLVAPRLGDGMEFLKQAIDIFLHLNQHLDAWSLQMGAWLYLVLFAVIFCETGLVVTPILPGDSLLFAVGALAAGANSPLSLPVLLVLLIAAAILGDAANYTIGFRLGPKVFKYENSRLLNKKHLERTHQFYEKYGGKTIILARFIPIIRTFAPFVAGIGKMSYRRFGVYNVVGGAAWVAIFLLGGYRFGQMEIVKTYFHLVIVAIIGISVMPMAIEFYMAWRRRKAAALGVASAMPSAAWEGPVADAKPSFEPEVAKQSLGTR
jgi:membrane-associated protein